jgi:hypothetical protein
MGLCRIIYRSTKSQQKKIQTMASNIEFNPKLLAEVQKLGKFKYKKDAVNAALEEFIQKRHQKEIFQLFGAIDYDSDYDYKARRARS